MTETIELLSNQPTAPLEVVPAQDMLNTETIADGAMAELAEAVDEAYAEAGLEKALGNRTAFKNLGSSDDLGYTLRHQ